MTTYAYDADARTIHAVWPTGAGSAATTTARLHTTTAVSTGRALADGLSKLSATAWLAYAHPDLAPSIEAGSIDHALTRPNLLRGGQLRIDPDWLVEYAQEIGRTLVSIGSAGVRRAVLDDVRLELDAIDRALRGDLTGRAQQGVSMTRSDVSPVQLEAADRILHALPLGGTALFTDVEPTAACVAAAHWLCAAADVVSEVAGGIDYHEILDPDRAEESFDVVAPLLVLSMMGGGTSPRGAVLRLVTEAMCVSRGDLPDPDLALLPGKTVLDPARPAPHLLDRLVGALRICAEAHADQIGADVSCEPTRHVFDAAVRREAEKTAARLWGRSDTARIADEE